MPGFEAAATSSSSSSPHGQNLTTSLAAVCEKRNEILPERKDKRKWETM
jgi:hypothetical protein